ncbi:hypothetical protein ID866_9605, partial [Astraeus odoratus]
HHQLIHVQNIVDRILCWSRLQHNNIVLVLGVVTKFDYSVSIVCEWVPNGNAHDYVQDKDIDPRPLLRDIARGLQYLHNRSDPIVHGDLRGKNVLISQDGHALLADYGLIAVIDSSFSMTAATPIHPTVRWMAPEQINGYGKATTQGDIWAFAMTTLELFTREVPYNGIRDTRSVIHHVLRETPSRPSSESTCNRMTDGWWGICELCWERNESLRPSILGILNKIMEEVRLISILLLYPELNPAGIEYIFSQMGSAHVYMHYTILLFSGCEFVCPLFYCILSTTMGKLICSYLSPWSWRGLSYCSAMESRVKFSMYIPVHLIAICKRLAHTHQMRSLLRVG